jgi:subtilisin family serine protease
MHHSLLALSALVCAPIVCASAAPYEVIAQGERIALTLDGSRVAIGLSDGRSIDAESLARAGGAMFAGSRVERALAGWAVVLLDGTRDADALRAGVAIAADLLGDGAFVAPVFVGADGGPVIPTRDVLVRFGPAVNREAQRGAIERAGLTVVDADWAGMENAYRLRSAAGDGFGVMAQAATLAAGHDVVFVEPDMVFTGSGGGVGPGGSPTDFYFAQQWALENTGQNNGTPGVDVRALDAWGVTLGSPGVRVVVIDTGVDLDHVDLSIAGGADFTNDPGASGGAPVNGFDNHGTPVAGCIGALLDNDGVGVVGIAPNVSLYSARTFITVNDFGGWTSQASWTVETLAWAESLGARVTNNSNRYGFTSGAIASMYEQTRENGMVHFASAGNESAQEVTYPASLSTVNAVGAIDNTGERASFSNRSVRLAFAAPGVNVLTTDRTGAAGYLGASWVFAVGTSFASPYAAGVAALTLSARPSLSSEEVEWLMRDGARDLGAPGFDIDTGWGLVQAYPTVGAPLPSPADFGRLLPEDGASARPRDSLFFGWQPASFSSTFDLTITLDSSGAEVFSVEGLSTNSYLLDLDALEPGRLYRWQVIARNAQGFTEATSGPSLFGVRPAGDVSGDCAVDFIDLNQVLAVFGQSGPSAEFADVDGDGVVAFSDLNAVLGTFGNACE